MEFGPGTGPFTRQILKRLSSPGRSCLLELHFLEKLRDEQKFPGIEALKQQIARDVARAREVLGRT